MLDLHDDQEGEKPLRGEIHPSLMKLQNLNHLNLSFIDFNGSQIPKFIGSLSKLRYLGLSVSSFGGEVPFELGKLLDLRVLELPGNYLVGSIPFQFRNLSSLWKLNLDWNNLAGTIPYQLGNLSSLELQVLRLVYCKLGPGFPRWLHTQHNLYRLDVYHTEINDTIPEWFWRFARGVDYLRTEYSNLKGEIPTMPLQLIESPVILLASNQIEGSVPLFLLKARYVDISNNQLSKIFLSCGNGISALVESLGKLNLSSNKLSGMLPDCWNHFKSLAIFDLSNNQTFGRIPSSMGSLNQIRQLILRNNCLSGELPSLENVTKLELLDVGNNELSGPIPHSWIREKMKRLEILSLRMNKLEGTIPLHLCYLAKVRVLDLSCNTFTGPIPSCIDNLIAMAQKHVFNQSMNKFLFYKNGKVVNYAYFDLSMSVVWKGRELLYHDHYRLINIIDLSHNQLVGKLPRGIGKLVELRFLNLSTNNLSGRIISELGQLKSLEVLDLSRNHFSGEIPSSLEISSLNNLNLSNNNLSGGIPTGTQLQTFEASTYERNPDLCGRPLDRLCSPDDPLGNGTQADQVVDEVPSFASSFFESLGVGFATGFWIVFGSLLLIRSWRHAYFNFLNKLSNSIYVTTTLLVARWRKWLRN